jgi:hypothetical protein
MYGRAGRRSVLDQDHETRRVLAFDRVAQSEAHTVAAAGRAWLHGTRT